ncbi:P-loop containing nucleoside triphosphate hydrolase protein [Thozetella sp. PMI_491]|nr:P-loop containing nucleoside triphosphate hydrolase protein [Thozetella sp. PMI_491]
MALWAGKFSRQTWALTKKNFTIAISRSWFWTAFRSLVLPILVVTLLLEIPNLSKTTQQYGVGTPVLARTLAQSMDGSRKLAIVQPAGTAGDVEDAVKRLTEPLDKGLVVYLDEPSQVWGACDVDFHGNSNCHAVITFNDSPGSGRPNAAWNYSVQVDPGRDNADFNIIDHSGTFESFWLPLQVAIDNAIADKTDIPEAFSYSWVDQQKQKEQANKGFLILATYILSFVFFISMLTVVHHLSSMMSSERASGMSQLIDAMGGGAVWPRVFSYVIFFDLLYLPLWIILGCLMRYLLVPKTSLAIMIFWQIFTGWATTSSAVFATAWFKKSAAATTLVTGIALALAAVAAVVDNITKPTAAGVGEIAGLSAIFPSMNYVFFFGFVVRSELEGQPTYMTLPIPMDDVTYAPERARWVYHSGPYFLWIILIVQIIVFPLLAGVVESQCHGNNRRRRTFNTTPEAEKSHLAIETTGLEMHYRPSIWQTIFCCARKPTVKAVDGLSLTSQKRQILCLLGPNGSGKTTTLDMIAGFQKPTGGSININAQASQLGVCPQKNVMWDNLTVHEHLTFWNTLKSGTDNAEALEQLIRTCDLSKKRNTFAKNLSGGMKRKLQLACMLVGGSSVCLMDEVTSGLDPISRRVIWNAVLKERSRRTMVFTTHFLDESEVLSDHIVIVSLGKMKCQGTPAELKNQFGAGYRVHLPKSIDISGIKYPVADNGEHYVCTTPDSSSAAALIATLKDSRDSEVFVTGPTIEDVFLRVSEEPHVLSDSVSDGETIQAKSNQASAIPDHTPTRRGIFFRQFRALFLKRLIILRSQWWIYMFALVVPLVVTPFLKDFLKDFERPQCENLIGAAEEPYPVRMYGFYDTVVGPISSNQSVYNAFNSTQDGSYYYRYSATYEPLLVNARNDFTQYINDHAQNVTGGGMFIDNSSAPLIAYRTSMGSFSAISLTNVFNMARTGTTTHISVGTLRSLSLYNGGNSLIWSTIFCLLLAIYPAFFCLYPTYERRSKVRALQYSNGIRALPLWFSYMLFDLIFVLVISVICTVMISSQAPFWGIGHLWLIQFLYGIAAMLVAYIVSTFASSQPSAIAWSILIMVVEYILSIITMVLVQDGLAGNTRMVDGTTYGLGLIFPIQNLLRAFAISLNQYIVLCRGTTIINNPSSFYAYGGPIMLLIVQIIALFFLLIWLDGTVFSLSRPKPVEKDEEKSGAASGRPDIDTETARVVASQEDLLRMLHISKKFGTNTAVEDVSLGLREGEILALLGPNGAGKTTCINMIRGDIIPSSGSILLEGVDVQKNKRLAQTHLGVCPQFDALDMLTVKEHLAFYARCKGVPDIESDVQFVMSKVGISAHQHKLAAKLSGGQKRKLSLAIALLGNPPVLLLDEPSSAMDAASKRVLWKTLEAVAPGRSVLITTHSMEEADALATRAAIIARRLLAIGTTQELRKSHSNEYHVHLVLKSAPLSTPEEMQHVANWVVESFPTSNVQFEGENLGGQVRFLVPADSKVPARSQILASGTRRTSDDDPVSPISPVHDGEGQSFVRHLIETIEEHKDELGLDCYSIGAATMERVFLSVVKDTDAVEEEDEKKSIWRWLGLSRK